VVDLDNRGARINQHRRRRQSGHGYLSGDVTTGIHRP
jgi:hypothetical protein